MKKEGYTALYCAASIMQHLGHEVSGDALLDQYGLDDARVSWQDLRMIAKRFGCKTQLLRPTEEELREVPVPAVVRFQNGGYAVLGMNTDEAIFIMDPGRDKPVAMPKKTFLELWNGEVLIFTARFDWQQFVRKYNLKWFYGIIVYYKKYFLEAAAASFFLQLMGLIMPLCTQVIIDKVIGNNGMSTLTVLGVSLSIFCLFQAVMGGLRTYVLTHTTNKLDAILGTRLFRHLVSLPLPYYEHRRVGDTMMRIRALNSVREFLTGTALTTILDIFFSFVFIIFMLYYSVPLTLIVLLVVPLYLVQNLWAMPIFRRKLEAVWRTGAANNAFLVEAVTGMQTIKSLALEPQFNSRWEKLLGRYVATTFNQASFNILVGAGSQLIQRLIVLSIMWYGGRLVMAGEFTLGQLIAFQMVAGQAMTPLCNILGIWPQVQQTALSLERIGDILNTHREAVLERRGKGLDKVAGEIELSEVSFRYRLDLPLVLDKVSLKIEAGQKVGIVGRSGSGKSTLTGLIQKLYLPEEGRITLDGVDLAEADYNWLRSHIGTVMQENYLFNASIRDNIAVTKPTAGMDEVIRAAVAAGAHDFILELPEGYDTKVGERGDSLSGGQRQRIAIARAILANPPVLIFDEATSALDYETERIVMNNMEKIGENRTMLIIAHRLSTVEKCDKIIVVDKGSIAEEGSHEELLRLNGIYAKLYHQQEVLR